MSEPPITSLLDELVEATGMALREERERQERQIDTVVEAVGLALKEEAVLRDAAIGRAWSAASDAVRPAVDAAQARKAVLLRRRADTLETVCLWLRRCIDDAA